MLKPTLSMAFVLAIAAAPARCAGPPPEAPPAPQEHGFLLGEFLIKDYLPVQGSKTTLNFVAHAGVLEENASGFEKLLQVHHSRVRDQVLTAARLTVPEELQDPDLVRLRRRILLRLRHALPELPIEDVYFSEFQYFVE